MLKEHEAGAKRANLARKHRVSEGRFTTERPSTVAWMVSEAKRLQQLEGENAKVKKLLAEQMLDAAARRELLLEKW